MQKYNKIDLLLPMDEQPTDIHRKNITRIREDMKRRYFDANDADTQKYLCELIGTSVRPQHSISEHMDEDSDTTGYGRQISEAREFTIQPHELAKLNDVLLLTPYGFFRVEKFQMQNEEMKSKLSVHLFSTWGRTKNLSNVRSSRSSFVQVL